MAEETPTPSVPPPTPGPIPVSPIHVLSATLQNIVVAVIIAYAWLIAGKLDSTVALPSLFGVLGIDVLNRFRLPGWGKAAVMLIAASALSLAACTGAGQIDLKPYRTVVLTGQNVYQILCVPAPETQAAIDRCTVARVAVDVGTTAYNDLEKIAEGADAGLK